MQDFEVIEIVTFPVGGTTQTPQHDHGDFVFQSYAPLAMRYFRDIFDISVEGFLNSIAAEPLGLSFTIRAQDFGVLFQRTLWDGIFLGSQIPGLFSSRTPKSHKIKNYSQLKIETCQFF